MISEQEKLGIFLLAFVLGVYGLCLVDVYRIGWLERLAVRLQRWRNERFIRSIIAECARHPPPVACWCGAQPWVPADHDAALAEMPDPRNRIHSRRMCWGIGRDCGLALARNEFEHEAAATVMFPARMR